MQMTRHAKSLTRPMLNHMCWGLLLLLAMVSACVSGAVKPEDDGLFAIETTITARDDTGRVFTVGLGRERVILPDGWSGLHYFPDESVSFLGHTPRFRMLFPSAASTILCEGTDILHITSAREVLVPGGPGSFDNGYAGISGSCFFRDGVIYGVYHCEDQEGMGMIAGGIPGFYACVGAVVSKDSGYTWTKAGQVLTSSQPKEWKYYDGQNGRGLGNPSMVVDRTGKYLFLYYYELSGIGGRGVQICMARAEIPGDPAALPVWKKYFKGSFGEPALGGRDTPVVDVSSWNYSGAFAPFVFYSRKFDRYVMLLNINTPAECEDRTPLATSGIYITFSGDGIRWSYPSQLLTDYSIPLIGKSYSGYGTFIPDAEDGMEGWLVYCHSPGWGHKLDGSGTPHFMAGRRMSISHTSTVGIPGSEVILPEGIDPAHLAGYWKPGDGPGTWVEDLSGHGHWGVVKGNPRISGEGEGTGLVFDPKDGIDYVELCNSPMLESIQENDYTVYAVFMPLSIPQKRTDTEYPSFGIVMKQGWHVGLCYSDDRRFLMYHFLDGGTWAGAATAARFEPGISYHVAGTVCVSKGEAAIHVDGVLAGTSRFAKGTPTKALGQNLWRIGIASPYDTGYPFPAHGIICEVMIFDRVLSAEEIRKLSD